MDYNNFSYSYGWSGNANAASTPANAAAPGGKMAMGDSNSYVRFLDFIVYFLNMLPHFIFTHSISDAASQKPRLLDDS